MYLDPGYNRTRFFPDMWSLQNVRRPLVLPYSSKKSTFEWIRFMSIPPEKVILGAFLELLEPS